jgi:hypothetical protein
MRPHRLLAPWLSAVLLIGSLAPGAASARSTAQTAQNAADLHFGVLTRHPRPLRENDLQETLAATANHELALLLAIGIKNPQESCEDRLYSQRKRDLNLAPTPLVVSVAGSDWLECKNRKGRSDAVDRLNRLRDLLFADSVSLGKEKIKLNRLSENAKFRSYAENAHWQVGRVLFATVNLPAPNNNYRPEAGRNSEFEDRAIANRDWLNRLFRMASLKKLDGIVLVSDADLFSAPGKDRLRELAGAGSRDGLQELRKQLATAMQQFSGRVLLIDGQPPAPGAKAAQTAIKWRGRLGHLPVFVAADSNTDWIAVSIRRGTPELFSIRVEEAVGGDSGHH